MVKENGSNLSKTGLEKQRDNGSSRKSRTPDIATKVRLASSDLRNFYFKTRSAK